MTGMLEIYVIFSLKVHFFSVVSLQIDFRISGSVAMGEIIRIPLFSYFSVQAPGISINMIINFHRAMNLLFQNKGIYSSYLKQ